MSWRLPLLNATRSLLDAPVSGGRKIALDGSLSIAIGGDKQAATDCRGVFRTFANSVVHLGDVGSGQFAKLLNNALLAANWPLRMTHSRLAKHLDLMLTA